MDVGGWRPERGQLLARPKPPRPARGTREETALFQNEKKKAPGDLFPPAGRLLSCSPSQGFGAGVGMVVVCEALPNRVHKLRLAPLAAVPGVEELGVAVVVLGGPREAIVSQEGEPGLVVHAEPDLEGAGHVLLEKDELDLARRDDGVDLVPHEAHAALAVDEERVEVEPRGPGTKI